MPLPARELLFEGCRMFLAHPGMFVVLCGVLRGRPTLLRAVQVETIRIGSSSCKIHSVATNDCSVLRRVGISGNFRGTAAAAVARPLPRPKPYPFTPGSVHGHWSPQQQEEPTAAVDCWMRHRKNAAAFWIKREPPQPRLKPCQYFHPVKQMVATWTILWKRK